MQVILMRVIGFTALVIAAGSIWYITFSFVINLLQRLDKEELEDD
jgi:hypothetical protein